MDHIAPVYVLTLFIVIGFHVPKLPSSMFLIHLIFSAKKNPLLAHRSFGHIV